PDDALISKTPIILVDNAVIEHRIVAAGARAEGEHESRANRNIVEHVCHERQFLERCLPEQAVRNRRAVERNIVLPPAGLELGANVIAESISDACQYRPAGIVVSGIVEIGQRGVWQEARAKIELIILDPADAAFETDIPAIEMPGTRR